MRRWVWNSLRRGATPANVFSLAVLMIVAGGVAYASIPDPGTNLIHGCYDIRTGALRVIDGASQTCASGEAALNWNQHGINWRGAWNSTTGYSVGDAVLSGGSAYIAVQPSVNVLPTSTAAQWNLLAAKSVTAGPIGPAGHAGAIGAAGPHGPTGPQGDLGAAGAQGPRGAAGVAGPQGAAPTITAARAIDNGGAYAHLLERVFAGPPAVVTVGAGELIWFGGSASVQSGVFHFGLCHRRHRSVAPLVLDTLDRSASTWPLTKGLGEWQPLISETTWSEPGPGTWDVGLCYLTNYQDAIVSQPEVSAVVFRLEGASG